MDTNSSMVNQNTSYFPSFDSYLVAPADVLGSNTPNDKPYPIIDCKYALSDISARYFPIIKTGISRRSLQEYYDPYPDPTETLMHYFNQCTHYKTRFEQHQQLLHSLQISPESASLLPSPFFMSPELYKLQNNPENTTISQKRELLPHELGIWNLRKTKINLVAKKQAIAANAAAQSNGLTFRNWKGVK